MMQIARLKIGQPISQGEELGLWDQLEAKGWDLQSRLYLGFDSKRIFWSLIDDGGTDKKKTKGNKKSQ
jgi:hypothetical protein